MNMKRTVLMVVFVLFSVSGIANEEYKTAETARKAEEKKPLLFEGTFYLVNPQGEKRILPNAHISITTGEEPILEAETNESGQIFVNNLPEGNYVVLVESEEDNIFGTFEIMVLYGEEEYNDLFAAEFYLEEDDNHTFPDITDQARNLYSPRQWSNSSMTGGPGGLLSLPGILGAAAALGIALPLALIEESPSTPK